MISDESFKGSDATFSGASGVRTNFSFAISCPAGGHGNFVLSAFADADANGFAGFQAHAFPLGGLNAGFVAAGLGPARHSF